MDPKWIFVIHYDPRLRHIFKDASINTEKSNDDQPNIVQESGNIEQIGINDDVQPEDCELDDGDNIPLAVWTSRARGVFSQNDKLDEAIHHDNQQFPKANDLIEEGNIDDIQYEDQINRSGNTDIFDDETTFIDTEYDEGEDEDDHNMTLAEWFRKSNINFLQEHMNIDKEALEDIDADDNINEDF